MPQRIADIVSRSSTLSGVTNSKSEFVSYGDINVDSKTLTKLTENLSKAGYDYHELNKRVSLDYFIYGYAFISVAKMGKELLFDHVDASKIRFVESDTEIKEVAFCTDWEDSKKDATEIPIYPKFKTFQGDLVVYERSIIPIIDYNTNAKEYPLPKWLGCVYDAQVESLIGQYNANQFENGVTLSSILMFDFGENPNDETNDDDEWLDSSKRKLERNLKGTSNGRSGKSLIVPIRGDVEKPEYVTYPMEKEGSYLQLQQMIENNIIKANSWYRSLAGLTTEGQLGNNQQLKNEWQLAERLIRNCQDMITAPILDALGYKGEWSYINQTPLDVISDISKVTEILTNDKLERDSKRELLLMLGVDIVQVDKLVP